jgi:hypothetical protein
MYISLDTVFFWWPLMYVLMNSLLQIQGVVLATSVFNLAYTLYRICNSSKIEQVQALVPLMDVQLCAFLLYVI